MKISREIKVGITFIATVAVFIWGFNFLKGTDLFSKKRLLYAVYDKVDNLEKANKVKVNGLNIGQVSKLEFIPGSSRIAVEMYISNSIQIPKNSVAHIYGTDLLGSKAIEIQLGDSPLMAESGDTLSARIEQSLRDQVNEQVEPLKRKAIALINSVDSVMSVIQTVFNENTRNDLSSTIENIQDILGNIQRASSNLDTILAREKEPINKLVNNLQSISENLKDNNENISRTIDNFASISDTLRRADINQTISQLNAVASNLKGITEKLNRGEGTAGQLLHNDTLYMQLEQSTEALKLLLEDIRNNPKKYVKFSLF